MGITKLADLIRAGLDADQEAAQWASAGPWWVEAGEPLQWGDQRDSEIACSKGTVAVLGYEKNGALNAEHIVRSANPTTVLRDVAARRQLLDQALAWEHYEADDPWYSCPASTHHATSVGAAGLCECGRDERIHAVITMLTAPYQETT